MFFSSSTVAVFIFTAFAATMTPSAVARVSVLALVQFNVVKLADAVNKIIRILCRCENKRIFPFYRTRLVQSAKSIWMKKSCANKAAALRTHFPQNLWKTKRNIARAPARIANAERTVIFWAVDVRREKTEIGSQKSEARDSLATDYCLLSAVFCLLTSAL